MIPKIYKQFGTPVLIIFLPLLIIAATLLIVSGFESGPLTFMFFIFLVIFLLCLLIFYKLTITLNDESVSFKLGIGLVSKTYRYSDIKSCKAVKNSALNGIGIHMYSNGWIYNVSGRKAIELEFKNRSSAIRIGTDKPEEIAEIINAIIKPHSISEEITTGRRTRFNPIWIVVLILLLLPFVLLIPGRQKMNIFTDKNGLIIEGMYKMAIPYNDLIHVDTINSLPQIKMRTNGYALGNTLIGNFRLSDHSNVKLYVRKGFPPYILIQAKGQKPVYINFEDRLKTVTLYNELIENSKQPR